MIDKYKLGLRLLKYAPGIKQCALAALLFCAAGIITFLISPSFIVSGLVYVLVAGCYVVQFIYGLCTCHLVRSSPRSRDMQTEIAALIGLPVYLLLYGFVACMGLCMLAAGRIERQDMAGMFILAGFFSMLMMAYVTLANKNFVFSFIFFFLMFASVGIFQGWLVSGIGIYEKISPAAAVVIGLLEILAGTGLQYLISRAFYRWDLSKGAQLRSLQDHM